MPECPLDPQESSIHFAIRNPNPIEWSSGIIIP